MKKEQINSGYFYILYTVVVALGILFYSKNFRFSQYNELIFQGIFVVTAVLIPLIISKPKFILRKKDKRELKFALYLSVGASLVIESFTYYINEEDYFYVMKKSLTANFDISFIVDIILILLVVLIIYSYFVMVYNKISKENSTTISILLCASAFCLVFSRNTISNFLLGIILFVLITLFNKTSTPFYTLVIYVFTSMVFQYIYNIYSVFGIMHYFVFAFMIIGLICLDISTTLFEDILFYNGINKINFKQIYAKDVKAIFMIALIFGAYLLII